MGMATFSAWEDWSVTTNTGSTPVDPADAAEAARMLRAVLGELPPSTPTEVAVARRVEGAITALEVVAGSSVPEPPRTDTDDR